MLRETLTNYYNAIKELELKQKHIKDIMDWEVFNPDFLKAATITDMPVNRSEPESGYNLELLDKRREEAIRTAEKLLSSLQMDMESLIQKQRVIDLFLSQMEPYKREIFDLKFGQKMPNRQIARRLHRTEDNIKGIIRTEIKRFEIGG